MPIDDMDGTAGAQGVEAERCGNPSLLEGMHREDAFEDACCTHGVTEVALERRDGNFAHRGAVDGRRLHLVVIKRGSAVGRDAEGRRNMTLGCREGKVTAFGRARRCGDVVGIVAHEPGQCHPLTGNVLVVATPFKYNSSGGFAQIEATAVLVERTARLGRHRHERLEPCHDETRLHIATRDDGIVVGTHLEQTTCHDERRKSTDAGIAHGKRREAFDLGQERADETLDAASRLAKGMGVGTDSMPLGGTEHQHHTPRKRAAIETAEDGREDEHLVGGTLLSFVEERSHKRIGDLPQPVSLESRTTIAHSQQVVAGGFSERGEYVVGDDLYHRSMIR